MSSYQSLFSFLVLLCLSGPCAQASHTLPFGEEEFRDSVILFKPILPGSVRSKDPWIYEGSGRVFSPEGKEILPYNQSKLLRDVCKHGLKAVQALFKQSILRIVKYDDGTLGLTENLQLLGGGNGGSSDRGSSGGDRSNRSCRVGDNCNTSRSQSLSSSSNTRDRGSDRDQRSVSRCEVASSSDRYCRVSPTYSDSDRRYDRERTQRSGTLTVTVRSLTLRSLGFKLSYFGAPEKRFGLL